MGACEFVELVVTSGSGFRTQSYQRHSLGERWNKKKARPLLADLTFSQDSKLRLSTGSSPWHISLLPGLGEHRLVATVDVESIGLPESLPIQISGELFAQFGNTERWIRMFHPTNMVTRGFKVQVQLMAALSDGQLHALEALREGRDLSFRLSLNAVLLQVIDGVHPQQCVDMSVPVAREAWARQLEQLGAAVWVEVLVPLPPDGTELSGALRRIREAKAFITDGRYEQAVSTARLAIDYIRTVIPPGDASTKARDRDQAQRWSALVETVHSLASAAVHDDSVTAHFTWSRDDAVTIVSTIAGLLSRLPR